MTYLIEKSTQKFLWKIYCGNMAISFYSYNDIVLFSRRKVSGHWRADGMLPFLTIWMVMSPARVWPLQLGKCDQAVGQYYRDYAQVRNFKYRLLSFKVHAFILVMAHFIILVWENKLLQFCSDSRYFGLLYCNKLT